MVKIYKYKKAIAGAVLLLAMLFAACRKQADTNTAALPVVEAYIMPGKNVEVKVSLQKGLVDTNAYGLPISGLALQLSDGTNTRTLTEDVAGHYQLEDQTFVKSTGVYSLQFTYNNLPVTASTTMPSKPAGLTLSADTVIIPKMTFGTTPTEFIPVNVSWSNTESYNHILVFKYQETWKSLISNRFNRDTTTSVELNAVQANNFELSMNTFKYYGRYKVILMRVNAEYLEMLNNSSTSSHNLTNAPTNVTNGLGIFTAMQADTLNYNILVKAEE